MKKWPNKYFEWENCPFIMTVPFFKVESVGVVKDSNNNHLHIVVRHGSDSQDDTYHRVPLDKIPGQIDAYKRWLNDSK